MNVEALEEIFNRAVETAKKKNADYAGTIDNIGMTGVHGIAIRLMDKVARVHNLSLPGKEAQVKDESIEDTFRDIVNYAAFGIMLLEGTWGKEDKVGWSEVAVPDPSKP